MYKKIIITLLIISPLYFLFIGYPINSKTSLAHNTTITTSRCYAIGNTIQFLECFKGNKTIGRLQLIQQTLARVNDLQQGMGYLLLLAFIIQLIILTKIIYNRNL